MILPDDQYFKNPFAVLYDWFDACFPKFIH